MINEEDLTDKYDINEVIKKVCKAVLYFKRSLTKNDAVLQKYVKEEKGNQLSLLLDVKTGWNSLLTMPQRFIDLKTCIQKSLIDLNHPVTLNDSEF